MKHALPLLLAFASLDAIPFLSARVVGGTSVAVATKGISLGYQEDRLWQDDGGLGAAMQSTPNASYAACEVARATRLYLRALAQVDARLCALRQVAGVEDGKPHAYTQAGEHVRVQVDAKGLRLDVCVAGKQTRHVSVAVSGGKLTARDKALDGEVVVHGTVDGERKFTGSKLVTVRQGEVSMRIEQSEARMELQRAAKNERIFALFELLDHNIPASRYALDNLAVGDGAAILFDGDRSVRQAWNGDTWEATSAVPQLAAVSDVLDRDVIIAPATPVALTFRAEEAYDCGSVEDLRTPEIDASRCVDLELPAGPDICRSVSTFPF